MNQNQSDFGDKEMNNDSWNRAIPLNTDESRAPMKDDWVDEIREPLEPIHIKIEDASDDSDASNEYHPSAFRQPSRHPLFVLFRFFIAVLSFMFVSVFVVFIYNYDISYTSAVQMLIAAMPTAALFVVFLLLNKQFNLLESILFMCLDCILVYLLFRTIMAHGLQELYSVITFQEAWKLTAALKETADGKEMYFGQAIFIMGVNIFWPLVLFYSMHRNN